MRRFHAAAALAALLSFTAAAAGDFTVPSTPFDAFRIQTLRLRRMRQRDHVMGGGRFNPGVFVAAPDVSAYPVRGIDVSHYDGAVDWKTVAGYGVSFAYIKATEGGSLVDQTFAGNWKGASTAGVLRGAYHFYDFCVGGSAQADNFVKTVPVDAGALPPTIDLEASSDCRTMPGKAAFRAQLAAFVGKLTAAYGKTLVIYVNAEIYAAYFQGEKDSYKVWIADVSHAAPQIPGRPAWAIWQYAWHGKVPGIAGEVDLDAFNGNAQALAALAKAENALPRVARR